MKPLTIILLDKRRSKKSGRYPVKLRITYFRKQRYYSMGIDLTEDEFQYMMEYEKTESNFSIPFKRKLKEHRIKCDTIIVRANEVIDQLSSNFSFNLFEKLFYKNKPTHIDVYSYYEELIEKLMREGNIGNATNYQTAMRSFKSFAPKLNFQDVDVEFLKSYERWFLSKGKSITTVSIYTRTLRSILNIAIGEGIISKEINYPFGKRKYQVPASKNIKKALTLSEIAKIYRYQAIAGTWWEKARDFFIFSYLGNGMNMKDIALLKFKNIDGDYIRFSRAKTINTNRTSAMPISIYLSSEMRVIINKWKNIDDKPDNFLFSILDPGLSPTRERVIILQFIKMVNKYLRLIAKEVGIDKPITTYYARHSFATILRRSGASTELISESLGHSSLKTTYSYLDSFEDEKKKEMLTALTNFSPDSN